MLTKYQVAEVKKLLLTGISQRRVSKLTGISRGSIASIITGKWDKNVRDRIEERDLRYSQMGRYSYDGNAMPTKCPVCGGLVYPPCLACNVRRLGIRSNIDFDPGVDDSPVALIGDDLIRYNEIKAALDANRRQQRQPVSVNRQLAEATLAIVLDPDEFIDD